MSDRLAGLVRAMQGIWARGEFFYGRDIVHVSGVTITGRHAFVRDCDDTSQMGLLAGGHVVPGSRGHSHVNLITGLDLVAGRWLVQFQLIEDLPCTP